MNVEESENWLRQFKSHPFQTILKGIVIIIAISVFTFITSFVSKKAEQLAVPSDSHSNLSATKELSSKRQEEPDKPVQSKQSKDTIHSNLSATKELSSKRQEEPDKPVQSKQSKDTMDNQGQSFFVKSIGIMWQKTDGKADCAWLDAHEYCEQLTLDGYDDWRLPGKDELARILLASNDARPFASQRDYWTSTMTDNQKNAWLVRFPSGIVHHRPIEKPQGNARCVRRTIN